MSIERIGKFQKVSRSDRLLPTAPCDEFQVIGGGFGVGGWEDGFDASFGVMRIDPPERLRNFASAPLLNRRRAHALRRPRSNCHTNYKHMLKD
jgi:hypothetical protein